MPRRDFTITITGYVEEPNGERDVAEAVRHAMTSVDCTLRANGGEALDGSYEMATTTWQLERDHAELGGEA